VCVCECGVCVCVCVWCVCVCVCVCITEHLTTYVLLLPKLLQESECTDSYVPVTALTKGEKLRTTNLVIGRL